MRILTDQDIDRVPLRMLSEAISAHIVADASGETSSHAARAVAVGRGHISLGVGGRPGYAGFVASQILPGADVEQSDQVVAGWDATGGKLFGLAVGHRLSAIRTECIGGLALDTLAPHTGKSLALIGTGKPAHDQLTAALAVRQYQQIRVYDLKPVAANELAKYFRSKTQTPVQVSSSPEEAVHGADVVILATNSGEPLIHAEWVAPHAHVTTIGPSLKNHHELPVGIVHRARTIVSDSPQQIRENPEHFLKGEQALKRIGHLGSLIGKFNPDKDRGMTLFLSAGLAGTEVAALKAAVNFLSRG